MPDPELLAWLDTAALLCEGKGHTQGPLKGERAYKAADACRWAARELERLSEMVDRHNAAREVWPLPPYLSERPTIAEAAGMTP